MRSILKKTRTAFTGALKKYDAVFASQQRSSVVRKPEQFVRLDSKFLVQQQNAVIPRLFMPQQPLADGRLVDAQDIGKLLLAQVVIEHGLADNGDITVSMIGTHWSQYLCSE